MLKTKERYRTRLAKILDPAVVKEAVVNDVSVAAAAAATRRV